jgi:phage gp29-like protein
MVDAAALPPPVTDEVSADRGVGVGADYVNEIVATRDDVLATHGKGDLALYERLTRDDQVYPTFLQRRMDVVAREWKVDPGESVPGAGPSPLDIAAADDLRRQLKALSWDRITMRMLAGLMYGYGVGECMFSLRTDGRVNLDAVKVRRAARFVFDGGGRLNLVREGGPVLMPERKFWRFTCGAEDDDDFYGRGLGHWLYWPVWFKRNGLRFWSLFLERFSSPTPKMTVPAGTTEEARNKLLGLLDSLIQGGKIVIPKGVELELLQSMKDSGGDYDRFIARMDASIAKIVLTQTMTTDAAATGLGSNQATVQERAKSALTKGDSDLLTESFIMGPARWLTEWNYPGAATPVLYRDFAEPKDLAAAATRDQALVQVGWRPTAKRVLDTYGEGYEPIATDAGASVVSTDTQGVTPDAAPAAAKAASATPAASFAEPPRDATVAVDELVGGEGWRKVIGPEVDRIDALLGDARSLDEVRDRLGELALADPAQLVDGLSRVMFAARVQGEAGAEDTGPTDPTNGGAL